MAQKVRLGGELDPRTVEGIAADAKTIIDRKNGNKRQDDMNAELAEAIAAKQATLVSGTNIKTINSQSILGPGNIDIQGGGGSQVQSDWNQADNTQPDYIKNKPNIPDVSGKADKSEMSVTPGTGANADKTTIQLKQGTSATVLTQHQDISGKQDVINDLSTIRSGAEAGAVAYQKPQTGIPSSDMSSAVQTSLGKADTAQQPATTLAGYGIIDGATKTELQSLESEVDSKLEEQDAAITLLDGHDVIVVDNHTTVASPDTQKIYREPYHTEQIDGQGTEVSLIGNDYYSYLPIVLENDTTYVGLNNCVFINVQNSTIIGNTLTTTSPSGDEQYAVAKQVDGASDVADLSYTKTNDDVTTTKYTDWMCIQTSPSVVWKKIATYDFPGLDDVPTVGSNNLVKSGGVFNELALGAVYDVSVHNNGAVFESLSALLNHNNINTLIPTAVRKGGMSIKFIQGSVPNSDNKYVKYRLTKDEWSANLSDWQKEDLFGNVVVYSKQIVAQSSQQAIVSPNNSRNAWGKVLNVTVEQVPTGVTINIGIYADGSETRYLQLLPGSQYITSENNITAIYLYVENAASDGEVRVKVAYGDIVELTHKLESADLVPTANSSNLVISGGVQSALSQLEHDMSELELQTSGILKESELYSGTINGNSGLFFATPIRVTNLHPFNTGDGLRVMCKGDIIMTGYVSYVSGKSPDTGGTKGTDFLDADLPSNSQKDCVFPYNPSFPNFYIVFSKADGSSEITPAEVVQNVVVVIQKGFIYEETTRISEELTSQITDVERAYQNDVYFTKKIQLTKAANINIPITIKKGSVINLSIESSSIQYFAGVYFRRADNTNVATKYTIRPGNTYSVEIVDDVAYVLVYFDGLFNPGYTSGDAILYIGEDNSKFAVNVPTQDALQHFDVSSEVGEAVSIIFRGDATKTSLITGVYLKSGDVELLAKYDVHLNEWYTFGKFDKPITRISVYTTASKVTAVNTIVAEMKYSNAIADDMAFEHDKVINAALDKRISVPDYYFTDNYLQNKVARINKLAQEAGDDAFVFTTDEHWEYNARTTPAIINYLDRYCNISKHISTGDHLQNINEYGKAEVNKQAFDFVSLFDLSLRRPKYSSVGNHEYLTSPVNKGLLNNVNFDNWVRYTYYMNYENVVIGNPDRMYFYYDDKVKKLRYIFLCTFNHQVVEADASHDRSAAYENLGSEQLAWFRDTALNVESGYGIIVVTHWLISTRVPNQLSNETDINIPQSTTAGIKDMVNILLNYSGNGEIIAVLFGHVHRDGVEVVDDILAENDSEHLSHNAFMCLATTCNASFWPESGYPTEYMPYRVEGTISESAFDFCILNRSKHRFDFVRIGYPASLRFYYDDTLEERAFVYQMQNVAVNGTKTLEHDITGTAVWNSSNTSIATVSNGVVTGISAGIAKITVEDTVNHRAIVYMVKAS